MWAGANGYDRTGDPHHMWAGVNGYDRTGDPHHMWAGVALTSLINAEVTFLEQMMHLHRFVLYSVYRFSRIMRAVYDAERFSIEVYA